MLNNDVIMLFNRIYIDHFTGKVKFIMLLHLDTLCKTVFNVY